MLSYKRNNPKSQTQAESVKINLNKIHKSKIVYHFQKRVHRACTGNPFFMTTSLLFQKEVTNETKRSKKQFLSWCSDNEQKSAVSVFLNIQKQTQHAFIIHYIVTQSVFINTCTIKYHRPIESQINVLIFNFCESKLSLRML